MTGATDWFLIWRDIALAAQTAQRMQAVSLALLDVMAARLSRFGAAIGQGAAGDFSEQARCVPEKIAAFSEAGEVASAAWWDGQRLLANQFKRNANLFLRHRPAGSAELAVFWRLSVNTGLRMFGLAVRGGRDALTPIESVVNANRRRLCGAAASTRRLG